MSGVEQRRRGEQIEFRICLQIDLNTFWVEAYVVVDVDVLADRVFQGKPASLTASEFGDLGDCVGPSRGIESCIVDRLDDLSQLWTFILAHWAADKRIVSSDRDPKQRGLVRPPPNC